jgi:hypothetical protein
VNEACFFTDPTHFDLVFLVSGLFMGEIQTKWYDEYILATWNNAYSHVTLLKSFF